MIGGEGGPLILSLKGVSENGVTHRIVVDSDSDSDSDSAKPLIQFLSGDDD
jgi:hypothetical protein